jgi:DNA-binding NtrC family response regulator
MSSDTRHILVVEDDPDVRDVMRVMIEEDGFRVSVVGDVASAREVLDRGGVLLIVSDEGLKRDSGLTVAEEARGRRMPVIVMTGNLERQQEFRDRGFDFMPKPFKLDELHRRIEQTIGRNEPRRAAPQLQA